MKIRSYWQENKQLLLWSLVAIGALSWLLLYKLGTLVPGLSLAEVKTAITPVGLKDIFHHPFDLHLQLVRSVVFTLSPDHGAFLTRLPNTLFGALTVLSFGWLVWLWHGSRTAIFATILFACGAWTLHVSRYANADVLYLWAVPTLLLVQLLMQHTKKRIVWYGGLLVITSMLYIPGLVWLVGLSLYLQRKTFIEGWKTFGSIKARSATVLAVVIWLPLLIIHLARSGQFMVWLGLPAHFAGIDEFVKQLVAVFVHLFVRGPQYPELWLARLPILDAFTLIACVLGVYFYARHWQSRRSRLLGLLFAAGVPLVALGGAVDLSLLVSIAYLAAATGIAYLSHDWLKVFPNNPVARGFGIGLIAVAVIFSCTYNLRAYFIAWPHNPVTQAVFRYHR